MAIALLANAAAGSPDGNAVTTASIDTTGATFLVLVLSDYSANRSTISDSKGNTWVARTSYVGGVIYTTIFYAQGAVVVGTGHTFTATKGATTTYPTIAVAAFSEVANTPYDTENGAGSAAATSRATGSITPSENDCLIISGCTLNAINTLAVDSSMTITNQVNLVAGQHLCGGLAYKIQTTAAAINPTWSWGTSTNCAATIASFKIARSFPPRPKVFSQAVQHAATR